MWAADLPPFVPFFAAALLIALARSHALRAAVGLLVPLLGGLHLWLDVDPGLTTYRTPLVRAVTDWSSGSAGS